MSQQSINNLGPNRVSRVTPLDKVVNFGGRKTLHRVQTTSRVSLFEFVVYALFIKTQHLSHYEKRDSATIKGKKVVAIETFVQLIYQTLETIACLAHKNFFFTLLDNKGCKFECRVLVPVDTQ